MPGSKTIITSSRRLSRHLRFLDAASQLQQGKRAWNTLDCLPWTAWCHRLYSDLQLRLTDTPRLLTDAQQEWLWQGIIRRSRYREKLLQVNATARQVMHAYLLCKQWQIPVFPSDLFLTEEALAFRNWVETYEAQKLKHGWIDSATLPDWLRENIDHVAGQPVIEFHGFEQFTPQQQSLRSALEDRGYVVKQAATLRRNKHVAVHAAADKRSELLMAAWWAKQKSRENPGASVGIVSPRLRHIRDKVISAFTEIMTPNAFIEPSRLNTTSWSVAVGKPLAEYPMIDTALELLALGRRRVAAENLGKLLHSRFIKACDSEQSQRALFDMWLRQLGIEEFSLRSLYRLTESEQFPISCRCEQFVQLLKDFEIALLSQGRQQTLRQWSISFSQWLGIFGWPGQSGLNSNEHQTLQAWQECLSDLGQLDPTEKKVGYAEAFALLRRMVVDKQFQPETAETQIQITGMTGTAGMQFDYLWILDMQDDYWPEQPVPNAFIPTTLLKEYAVPGATAESRLLHARDQLELLRESATEVVFSYARQEGDRECRPSTLISPWLEQPYPETPVQMQLPADVIFADRQQHTFIDEQGPAIVDGDVVTGGSSLFRDQSLCAFRAFARHRLHATTLQTIDIGLSAAQRGNLTHLALQYLWQRLRDRQQLEYLSDNERSSLVRAVVSEAIKRQASKLPEIFSERFSTLEQRRLEILLESWLQVEKTRVDFKVVATEEWRTVNFCDLEVHLCVDRLDELADGRYVIVDYKTGQARKSDWNTDNFNEPQLPLYAVTHDKNIAAIAFASLKSGNLKYIGEADGNDILPGVEQDETFDWNRRMAEWRQSLQELSQAFRQGNAAVEPLVTACRYCDLQSLCRIYERASTLDSEMIVAGDDSV